MRGTTWPGSTVPPPCPDRPASQAAPRPGTSAAVNRGLISLASRPRFLARRRLLGALDTLDAIRVGARRCLDLDDFARRAIRERLPYWRLQGNPAFARAYLAGPDDHELDRLIVDEAVEGDRHPEIDPIG